MYTCLCRTRNFQKRNTSPLSTDFPSTSPSFLASGLLQCYKVSVFDHLQDLLPQPKYIPVEPSHGLYFCRSTPSKQGLNSNQNKGHLGSRYMCTMCIHIYIYTFVSGSINSTPFKRGINLSHLFLPESHLYMFVYIKPPL